MSEDEENIEITTLERKDLITGAIQKHKRFLDEFTAEFNGLDEKLTSLKDQVESAKTNKEYVSGRTEVLKEKRQQLYHQAEQVLGDISSFPDMNAPDNKLIHSINDTMPKLKSLRSPDEEKQIVDSISDRLSGISINTPDIQRLVMQMRSRMGDALDASVELASINGTDRKFNEEHIKLNRELENILPRHKWLENRTKSHREGLAYWEDAKNGDAAEKNEVVAS